MKTDVEKVRQDIKDYEKYKRLKGYGNLGIGASLVGLGIGGYKNNPKILAPAATAAFLSGFGRQKARKEEKAALNRIKKFYDLRPRERESEKVAVMGGIAELVSAAGSVLGNLDTHSLSAAVQHGFQNLNVSPEIATIIGAATPTAIDIATLPWVAHKATESTRQHMYVAAKDAMGLPLTAKEKFQRSLSTFAKSEQMKIEKMDPGLRKTFNEYFKGIYGPMGTGGDLGEQVGGALKKVTQFSPRHANLALGAIKDEAGRKVLQKELRRDSIKLQRAGKILDSAIDEVPLLRRFLRSTGKSSADTIKKVLHDPDVAIGMANAFKEGVKNTVRAGKYVAGGASLALLGAGLGSLKKLHPLHEDKLPELITAKKKEELYSPPSFSKII